MANGTCELAGNHLFVYQNELHVIQASQAISMQTAYFLPMNSTFVSIALFLSCFLANAQPEVTVDLAHAIWSKQVPVPDPATLGEVETELIRLCTEKDLECSDFQEQLTLFAALLKQKSLSKLYPSIFLNPGVPCPEWPPFVNLLIADACYVQGDLDEATQFYRKAISKLEPDGEAYLMACLNSGACLIHLEKFSEAIDTYKGIINHPFEKAASYRQFAQINLSAAQLNAGYLNDALQTIRQIPPDDLTAYWKGIHYSNALTLYQKLGDYRGSDSIWQHHLSQIPFESIPGAIHKGALRELLQAGDYLDFIRFRKQVLQATQSPLLDSNGAYYPLFAADSSESNLLIIWDLYRDVQERQRDDHLVFINEIQPQLQSELLLIQDELGKAQQSSQNWKLTSALIVLTIFSILLIILLVRSHRLRRHFEELPVLSEDSSPLDAHVDEDDLVILAQALTYGKGLQKALLIIRRLREGLSSAPESRLNLENIEFYDQLNEREKVVAGYIASGFNSKEIAQMLHVTPKYTYNIRSRIRAKLCVPDAEDLLEWFRRVSVTDKP